MHSNRLLLLAAASVALLLSLAVIFAQSAAPSITPEVVSAAAADPKVQAAIARSETTGLAQQQPIERLAVALLDPPPAPAPSDALVEISPAAAAEIAASLLVATDGMWFVKQPTDDGHFEPTSFSMWADYWIAIWPDLDRHIAAGLVTREVKPVARRADGSVSPHTQDCCIMRHTKDGVRCTVNTDNWCVELTFHKDRAPLPELFARAMTR